MDRQPVSAEALKEEPHLMFRTRPLFALAVMLVATALSAAPASAQLGPSGCDTPDSSPVFSPWLDTTNYFLAPDGGFENGAAGWDLDGASVGSGNEAYGVSGPGASSLALSAGDSATSPEVCVGIEHPTFRYFARRGSAGLLRVQVVLDNGLPVTVGTLTGGASGWSPSPITLIGANLLPVVTGGSSTDVRFRFTAVTGSWQVDDVYVDPRGNW
jgi:hypothetical protein